MAQVDSLFTKLGSDPTSNPQNPAESFFDSIGLMRGSYAPVGRAAVGGGLGALIMFAVRPSFAFNADGSPKPWGSGKGGTSIPWFTLPIALAIFSGIFV